MPQVDIAEAIADLKVVGDITVTTSSIMRRGDSIVKGGLKE